MPGRHDFTALDTRLVLRVYAALVGVAGLLLIAWGPAWIAFDVPLHPFAGAGLIRLAGAGLVAAALVATAFSRADAATARGEGLLGLSLAHAVIYAVFALQTHAVWPSPAADIVAQLLFASALVLFGVSSIARNPRLEPRGPLARWFGAAARPSTEQLRSRYEEQIRAAAGQEERNRLARDLHDSIKQQLFAIQTSAAAAAARFDAAPADARHLVDEIRASAREAMTEMEAMLDQLRAVPLENVGLVEALKRQCEALGFRTGARVTFEAGPLPASDVLAPGAQQAIFRVAQETLANIGRHARAASVRVSLGQADAHVHLTIDDDGQGFSGQGGTGMGLANMRARADEFHGTLEVVSRAGHGTRVRLELPLHHDDPDGSLAMRQIAWLWGSLLVLAVVLAVWQMPILFGAIAVVAAVGLREALRNWRELRARTGDK
jgi:signal transduction histidine kinase